MYPCCMSKGFCRISDLGSLSIVLFVLACLLPFLRKFMKCEFKFNFSKYLTKSILAKTFLLILFILMIFFILQRHLPNFSYRLLPSFFAPLLVFSLSVIFYTLYRWVNDYRHRKTCRDLGDVHPFVPMVIITVLIGFVIGSQAIYSTFSIWYTYEIGKKALPNALVKAFNSTLYLLITYLFFILIIIIFLPQIVKHKILFKIFSLLSPLLITLLYLLPLISPVAVTLVRQHRVEARYHAMISHVRSTYVDCACDISNVWKLTVEYYSNFMFTHNFTVPKPRQLIVELPIVGMWNKDFVSKLAALQAMGACEDFALALTALIKDVLGCESRIVLLVNIRGDSQFRCDHAIPEVKINGEWYIVDISYTTWSEPLVAEAYAEHLKNNFPNYYEGIVKGICKLIDYDTHQDLSVEHGFSP